MKVLKEYMEETFNEEMRATYFFDENGNALDIGWDDYENYVIVNVEKADTDIESAQKIIVKLK